jgi:hypothetical protein
MNAQGDEGVERADDRDLDAYRRDMQAAKRDIASERRDQRGERRDAIASKRDDSARRQAQAVRFEIAQWLIRDRLGPEPDSSTDSSAGGSEQELIDREILVSDAAWARETLTDMLNTARKEREQAAAERRSAAIDRAAAAKDRRSAAADRASAVRDRAAAAAARDQAQIDVELTLDEVAEPD